MKKSKLYIWIGIVLEVLFLLLNKLVYQPQREGKSFEELEWPLQLLMWALFFSMIGGIVLIVYGARLSKKEKRSQSTPQSIGAQTQVHVCKNCGNGLAENALFCNMCGTKVVTEAKKHFCKNCGNELTENALFCNMCGTKVVTEAKKHFCKNCGNELTENALFCNMCGTKTTTGQE